MKKKGLLLVLLAIMAMCLLLVACSGKVVLVRFYVGDELFATEKVTKGQGLDNVPDVPEREGYVGKWSVTNFDEINSDLTVLAQYTISGYNVTFYADDVKISTEWVKFGKTIANIPEVPKKEGYDGAWDVTDFVGLTRDTVVKAVYTKTATYVYFYADEYVYRQENIAAGTVLAGEYYEPYGDGYVLSTDAEARADKVYYTKTRKILYTREIKDGEITDVPIPPAEDGENARWMQIVRDANGRESLSVPDFTKVTAGAEMLCRRYVTVTLTGGATNDAVLEYDVGETVRFVSGGVEDREDYEFSGWYADEDRKVAVTYPFVANENRTFYAGWMNVKRTEGVTFEGNVLSAYTGTDTEVFVPYAYTDEETGEKIRVTEVKASAFRNKDFVRVVHLPATVTAVGGSAFAGCSALETLDFPDGCALEELGASAFEGCEALKNFTFSETVRFVGERAFYGCRSLRETPGLSDTALTIVSPETFALCDDLASVTIPAGVTTIGAGAFSGDEKVLITFKNADGLQTIGERAFESCRSFDGISAPSLTSVGQNAYAGCRSVLRVTAVVDGNFHALFGELDNIPSEYRSGFYPVTIDGITYAIPLHLYEVTFAGEGTLPSRALYDVYSVKRVSLYGVKEIEEEAFFLENYTPSDDSDFSIALPSSLRKIGDNAFRARGDLRTLSLPGELTEIGESAFADIATLSQVSLPLSNALKKIGKNAFAQTKWFEEFEGPVLLGRFVLGVSDTYCRNYSYDTVNEEDMALCEEIAPYAFYGNAYLKKVTLGTRVSAVGDYAFANCALLEEFVFDDNSVSLNRRTIGENVLDGCVALKKLTLYEDIVGEALFTAIPDGLTTLTIGYAGTDDTLRDAYSAFTNVRTLVIDEGYLEIDENAFASVPSLESVTLSTSVRKIGAGAFEGLPLTEIVLPEDGRLEEIDDRAFFGSKAKNVTFPDSVLRIGKSAFENSLLETFVAGENLQTIDDNAFKNAALTRVTLNEGLTKLGDFAFFGCAFTALNTPASLSLGGVGTLAGNNVLGSLSMATALDVRRMLIGENGEDTLAPNLSTIKIYAGDVPDSAFKDNAVLQSVTLYKGVTGIGESAFEGCAGIRSVTVPNTVTTIGARAFANCRLLTSCQIESVSAALTSVGKEVFAGDERLTYVLFPDTVLQEKSDWTGVFDGCVNLSTSALPKNIVYIGDYAYRNCASLTTLKMSDDVVSIGISAFEGAKKIDLDDVVLNQLLSIGERAFYDCDELHGIKAENVTEIGEDVFAECDHITEITVTDRAITTYTNKTEGLLSVNVIVREQRQTPVSFAGCDRLETVVFYGDNETNVRSAIGEIDRGVTVFVNETIYQKISESVENVSVYANPSPSNVFTFAYDREAKTATVTGLTTAIDVLSVPSKVMYGGANYTVTKIGADAFFENDTLTKILLPASLLQLGDGAFKSAAALRSVSFENGSELTEIGDGAFSGCVSLEKIILPSSLRKIGDNAFDACSALRSVALYANSKLTTIGAYAFAAATNLRSFAITSEVSSIGRNAFNGCNSMTSFDFGRKTTLTEISSGVFGGCIALTQITLPETVTSIGAGAFRDCVKLSSFTLPAAIREIGENAFAASGLLSVTMPNGLRTIGKGAFENCEKLTEILLPDSVTSVGENAFSRNLSATKIEIGQNLQTIGKNAFGDCESVTEIRFGATTLADFEEGNKVFYKTGNKSAGVTVTIADTVRRIPAYAFDPASSAVFAPNVSEILFGTLSACREIGAYAFAYVETLDELCLPAGVLQTGERLFEGCDELRVRSAAAAVPVGFDENWAVGATYVDFRYENEEYGDYAFVATGEYVLLTKYNGTNAEVIVPDTLDGKKVLRLNAAFEGNVSVTRVIMGDYVEDAGSFYGCTALRRVELSDRITELGEKAFYGCSALNAFVVKEDVRKIEADAFAGCSGLTTVYVESPAVAATLDETSTVGGLTTAATGLYVKKGLDAHTATAFRLLPMEKDGYDVYSKLYYSIGVTDATVAAYLIEEPDKNSYDLIVEGEGNMRTYETKASVPWRAYVDRIVSVKIGENVTYLSKNAFTDMTALQNLYYECITATCADNAFSGTGSDWKLSVGENVTTIPATAFAGNTALKEIKYAGNAVTTIGANAFGGCTGLTSITIPSSVISIGNNAFASCINVSTVTIGERVRDMGDHAFYGLRALRNLYFNATEMNALTASTAAFASNENTANYGVGYTVIVGQNVKIIPAYAFYGCENILNVSFAERGVLGAIGSYAFARCQNVRQITLPAGLATLSDRCFYEATRLESITFGQGTSQLKDILPDAFANTAFFNNAASWVVPDGKDDVESVLILNNTYLLKARSALSGEYIITGTIKVVAHEAFAGCNALEYVRLPAALEYVGTDAFRDCDKLDTVYVSSRKIMTSLTKEESSGSVLKNATHVYFSEAIIDRNSQPGDFVMQKYTRVDESIAFRTGTYCLYTTAAWDLSKDNLSDVYAYLVNDEQNVGYYVLTVGGTGEMRDYTVSDAMPWKAYSSIIKTATVGFGVTGIGAYAFYGCDGITDFTLSRTVRAIGESAFNGCAGLQTLEIPESVETLGKNAFYGCVGLQSIRFNATEANHLEAENGVFARVGEEYEGGVTLIIGRTVKYVPAYLMNPSSTGENAPRIKNIIFASANEVSDSTAIGNYAFAGLKTLVSVTLPARAALQIIGDGAFEDCLLLETFVLTQNLHSVGTSAFKNCEKLSTVILNAVEFKSNLKGENAFENAGKNAENGLTLAVSDKAHYLPSHLFENSLYLKKVEFATAQGETKEGTNSELEEIGEEAFENCSGLTRILIPDSVTTVGEAAFAGCSSVRAYTAPFIGGLEAQTDGSEKTLFGYVFGQEPKTGLIETQQSFGAGTRKSYLPSTLATVEITKYTNTYYGAFMNCNKIKTVKYNSDTITTVYRYELSEDGKTMVVAATVPNGSIIGQSAFENCTSLMSAELPLQVASIGTRAFSGCISLGTITVSENVRTIGESAFENCTSMTTLYFNAAECADMYRFYGVQFISNNVFAGIGTDVEGVRVLFGAKVTAVPGYMFAVTADRTSPKLLSVSFAGTICKKIGTRAFYRAGADTLANVTLPSGVASIGEMAFEDTKYYKTAGNWSTDVLYIGNYLIKAQPRFDPDGGEYKVSNNTVLIADRAFVDCRNLVKISIPDSVGALGDYSFYGCINLREVQIGTSSQMTRIGAHAFDGCENLGKAESSGEDAVGFYVRANITEIGDYAFNNCLELTAVYLDSVSVVNGLKQNNFTTYGGVLNKAQYVYISTAVNATSSYVYSAYIEAGNLNAYYRRYIKKEN